MQQKRQGIHPKIPHRPQKRGEGGEEQHAAAHRPQQQIQPHLPLRPAEHEALEQLKSWVEEKNAALRAQAEKVTGKKK